MVVNPDQVGLNEPCRDQRKQQAGEERCGGKAVQGDGFAGFVRSADHRRSRRRPVAEPLCRAGCGHPAREDRQRRFEIRPEHRAVARQCVRESLVVLKNESRALPLAKNIKRLTVVGSAAADLGVQCGGWTVDWQSKPGISLRGGTTILAAIRQTVSPETQVIRLFGTCWESWSKSLGNCSDRFCSSERRARTLIVSLSTQSKYTTLTRLVFKVVNNAFAAECHLSWRSTRAMRILLSIATRSIIVKAL